MLQTGNCPWHVSQNVAWVWACPVLMWIHFRITHKLTRLACIEVYQILFDVWIFPHLSNRISLFTWLIISRVYELYYIDMTHFSGICGKHTSETQQIYYPARNWNSSTVPYWTVAMLVYIYVGFNRYLSCMQGKAWVVNLVLESYGKVMENWAKT